MRWVKVFILVCALVAQSFQQIPFAYAASSSIVINQLQTGGVGTGTAGQEFIELYNTSNQEVNVTGWCLTYSSSADVSQSTVGCVTSPDAQTKLYLKAKSYMTAVSPDYTTATGVKGDMTFAYVGGIASTAGHVRLLDTSKNEVDKLAWGTSAVHPETSPVTIPSSGKVLVRTGQDTDNNAIDFVSMIPSLHTSGLYEVVTIVDVCPNIVGAQATVPTGMIIQNGECVTPPPVDVCPNISGLQVTMLPGYMADENGNCQVDLCSNLSGLQGTVPQTYIALSDGSCVQVDVCTNIVGLQVTIPEGYKTTGTSECSLDLAPIKVTELLPNANGSDTGQEFIEFYNPTSTTIDLHRYAVYLGDVSTKLNAFPAGSTIAPGSYKTMSDTDLKLTLGNTTGRITLVGIDGTFVDRTDAYSSAAEDESWALIDGVWQYTNVPTPGRQNEASIFSDEQTITATASVSTCPAGKYRNPLTNRCRNIESDVSSLATCDADQYRNPETGRCRKIAVVASAAVCKDNQYRSEETGRCRKIEVATAAVPCKEGQERNPDTNRCRNAVSSSVPAAAYAVKPVKDTVQAFIGWWALGGIALVAVGYAAWEWRREVSAFINRMTGK